MSEQSKYVNAYIDHALGMLHEYVNLLIQSKSQLKVANELVTEKDKLIASLQSEAEKSKNNATEKNTAIQNAQKWEADYNAMKSKVSHMDTLVHQMADMKKQIQQKTDEYNKLIIEKDMAFKTTMAEKDAVYKNMVIEKDATYKSIITEKDAEIAKLLTKITELQSTKKTINRKKTVETPVEAIKSEPLEVKTVMENIPVILPVVQTENLELVRETDDF